MVLSRMTEVERGVEMSSSVKEEAEARPMARQSPQGSLEKPLHKTMKVKPVLCWKPQDVGNARTLGYQPKRAAKG